MHSETRAGSWPAPGGPAVIAQGFDTAWCAVGGERGGEIVPRWFGALADLGARYAHLFWAMPETGDADVALDRLRSVSTRWLAELRALDIEGSLSIKRGAPGPWLNSLAELSDDSLIVVGAPAARGARSSTIHYLLHSATRPVLLLPDLIQPPLASLWSRVVVDAGDASDADLHALPWAAEVAEWTDLASLDPAAAARTAVRLAEDVDASLIVFPRRAAALAPLALQSGTFPILLPPAPTQPG